MTFGEKIQALRKSRGWSQEQLAEQINVSRQALSKWENGTSVPDTNNVVQLAKLFGVSTDYLLLDDFVDAEKGVSNLSVEKCRTLSIRTVIGYVLILISIIGLLAVLLAVIPYGIWSGGSWGWIEIVIKSLMDSSDIKVLFAIDCFLLFVGLVLLLVEKYEISE